MAAAALFYGHSMDGIPDLIGRWLEADPTRTRRELADLCDVEPRTAGRWAKGETTPSGEDLERLALVMEADLGIAKEDVYAAARASRRMAKGYQPRTGTTLRAIDRSFVITRDDKEAWRELIEEDQRLSDVSKRVLRTFTAYFGADGWPEVFVDQERIASEWAGLSLDDVLDVWPDVVESDYVVRRNFPGAGWVFWLQFPDEK